MKLLLSRIETGVALPPQKFTTDLKEILSRCVNLNLSIETIHDYYRKLQIQTKQDAPNFKIALWFAWIDEASRTLHIRFGDGGEPQITVQEVAE